MSLSLVPIFADAFSENTIEGFPPASGAPFNACAPINACPTNIQVVTNPVYNGPLGAAGLSQDKLGVGVNDKILQYQFSSFQNPSICGVFLDGTNYNPNCEKCPCQDMGLNSFSKNFGQCDYFGAARDHASIMGPTSGGMYLNQRWG